MPETSDSLSMTDSRNLMDSLSFGQNAEEDVLSNASSASSLADLDGISALQDFTTLA